MPFIRYRTGDIGTLESDCACGRGFPMLGRVIGRLNDWVLDKHLNRIPVLSLTVPFRDPALVNQVRYYQFKQIEPGQLTVRLVPAAHWDEVHAKASLGEYGKATGLVFDFEVVSQLETYPSGKRRLLVH